MSGWIVRVLSTVKCSQSANEREGTAFHHTSDSTTFLEGVDSASLAPKPPSVVHAGPALVLTGEPIYLDQHWFHIIDQEKEKVFGSGLQ